jgi:2-polyprenyl-3-methyl-5-hydroxy-6-metoxy-1,4-benzoquinol methylase
VPAFESTSCPLCDSREATPLLLSATQMHRGVERFSFVRCRRCELVYLNPRVAAERLDGYYGEFYLPHRGPAAWGRWSKYVEEGQRRTDRARVRWARRTARLGLGTAVLDVGCGRPTFLAALVDRTGARGVGVDISDGGWTLEPERWETAGLELHRGTVQSANLTGPFDLVCMWHALEHDYRPMETLRRLHGLTRPGGTLLVEVPNYDSWTRRLHGSSWAGFHTPRHTMAFTPATLRSMLSRAGWKVERQVSYGTLDPYVLWWLGRQESKGRFLDGNLEAAFPRFMMGKTLTLPVAALQRWVSLGVQLAVARR